MRIIFLCSKQISFELSVDGSQGNKDCQQLPVFDDAESCGGRGCVNVRIVSMLFRSHVTGKCLTLYLKVSMKIVCDINCSTC